MNPEQNITYYGRWENSCGASDCGEVSIIYAENPIADFSALSTTILLSDGIAFFTNSSQNSESWLWEFGDLATSEDFEPSHQYTSEGTFTVSLTSSNPICASNNMTIEDYIIVIDPTSNSIYTIDEISIYPVPATDKLHITSSNASIRQVSVYGNDSKFYFSFTTQNSQAVIDISSLTESEYILVIETDNGNIVKRIIVLK